MYDIMFDLIIQRVGVLFELSPKPDRKFLGIKGIRGIKGISVSFTPAWA